MTENIHLDHGDVAITPFFAATQEMLGAAAPNLNISILNTTTIQAVAGAGNAQQTVAINGHYRVNTATVNAAHPGGVAGKYDIYVTGSDNSFAGSPTVDSTVYAFGLQIKATGSTPATVLWRKVGEIDWDGAAITAIRQTVGRRDDAPLNPTAPLATFNALRVRGATSQSAAIATFENAAGTALASITATGGLSTAGTITTSAIAGKTALALTSTGANTGLTIGADTTLYRSGAAVLKTDGTFNAVSGYQVNGTALAASHLSNGVTGTGAILLASTLAGYQATNSTITALGTYNTNGLLTQTALATFVGRTLTGTAGQVTVTNGSGVSGNPTISLPATITQATTLNGLTVADTSDTTKKVAFVLSGVTTATTRALTVPDASGTIALTSDITGIDPTLVSLAAYNTNGLLTQTAADTFAGRTLTGTAGQITVTNGSGVAGNPTISLPSTITQATTYTAATGAAALTLLTTTGASAASPYLRFQDTATGAAISMRKNGVQLEFYDGTNVNASIASDGTWNARTGYLVGGAALAASHLANGTTGSGLVVLKDSPTLNTATLQNTTSANIINASVLQLGGTSILITLAPKNAPFFTGGIDVTGDVVTHNGSFTSNRPGLTDTAFVAIRAADGFARFVVLANGRMEWGDGASTRDVFLERTGNALHFSGTGGITSAAGPTVLGGTLHTDGRASFGNGVYSAGQSVVVDGGTFAVQPSGGGDNVGALSRFKVTQTGIGFHNHVPIVKPTIDAAKTDLTSTGALAQLLRKLDDYGLIDNSST